MYSSMLFKVGFLLRHIEANAINAISKAGKVRSRSRKDSHLGFDDKSHSLVSLDTFEPNPIY